MSLLILKIVVPPGLQDVRRGPRRDRQPRHRPGHPGPVQQEPGQAHPRHPGADPEHDQPPAGQQQPGQAGQHSHLPVP